MARTDAPRGMADVDRTVHEPARFGIMAALSVLESADFLFLLQELSLTKGNLSQHMSKLEETGYVEVLKVIRGKRTHTMYRLTPEGRRAFADYRTSMQKILDTLPG